jgi:hypothetical protein
MRVERSWNPIVMKDEFEYIDVDCGISPNQLIAQENLQFPRKVILLVESSEGGGYWSKADWDYPIPYGATVRFVELPAGGGGGSNPLQIIAMIAIIAISVWFPPAIGLTGFMGAAASAAIMIGGSMLLNMFFGEKAPEGASFEVGKSVYSINAGGNGLRIGQPFAEWFGYQKRYPDLIQLSYSRIEGNDQYMYFFMCLGVGHYDIEGVFIGETPILEYQGANYTVLPPGLGVPSICDPSIVWTCMEVRGQELDTTGVKVIVSGRGTIAHYIEYDIQFPALVRYNKKGDKKSTSVTIVALARLVDDYGDPLAPWVELHRRTFTDRTAQVTRYSNKRPVPQGPGRYEVRVYRTTNTSTDSRTSDKAFIIGMRAYGPKHTNYGDVTCIEGKVRASERLSGDVTNKISVVATRKLYPVTDIGLGGQLTATTSIVDAIAYMVTSDNGGRQPASFVKWDVLSMVKDQVDGFGHGFSYVFSSQTDVMSAAQKAGQVSRLVPCLPGGQFCLVRDMLQEVPAVTYTEDDYDEGSFTLTYNMVTPDSPTCVKINYIDPGKWIDDYIVYYDLRGSLDRPYELDLEGCISRQQAYDLAVYLYRDMFDNALSVEFTTGLKGHIPSLFKKIALSASYVDWSSSGKVVAVDEANDKIYLSEPVDFVTSVEGYLYITRPNGDTEGPFIVTPTANVYVVNGNIPNLRTMKDDELAATSYLFGPIDTEPMFIRLMGIIPQERGKLRLFGTVIYDSLYSEIPGAPVIPPYKEMGQLLASASLDRIDSSNCWASWAGDAETFRVEMSTDGSAYSQIADNYAGTSINLSTAAAGVWVRVTPYLNGVLQTSVQKIASISTIAAPTGLAVNASSDSITATWNAVTGAVGYDVDLWVGAEEKTGVFVETNSASVPLSELQELGGPWPVFEVRVTADVNGQISLAATRSTTVPAPAAPTGLARQSILSSGVLLSWNTVSGATGYQVYVGTTSGFDPKVSGTLVYSGSQPSCVAGVSVATPYNHFFKVAATNAYYQNVNDLVFSAALQVTG